MGEIRIVGPGKTCGYPYLVCKKKMVVSDDGSKLEILSKISKPLRL